MTNDDHLSDDPNVDKLTVERRVKLVASVQNGFAIVRGMVAERGWGLHLDPARLRRLGGGGGRLFGRERILERGHESKKTEKQKKIRRRIESSTEDEKAGSSPEEKQRLRIRG